MKLESWVAAEEKARYKLVRTDTYVDIPGEIVAADEDTGECSVSVTVGDQAEISTLSLGSGGVRIIPRARR